MAGSVFRFGEFQLDCGRFELMRSGKALRVERKPLELLILLVSREGQLVPRAEIAQRLWSSEVFVDTEHGINTAIRKLRHLLRDDSDEPRFIQTVTGMGYRFVAPTISIGGTATDLPEAPTVEPAASAPGLAAETSATPSTEEAPKTPLDGRAAVVVRFVALTVLFIVMGIGPRQIEGYLHRDPNPPITSVAVLPLDNLSGDPGQEYFADGMTDELTTMLAKDTTLRIVSRTSAMQYKDAHRSLPEIARALNVDGILEGSVSRASGQVHMTLQLIRADTDAHVWAESYDRSLVDSVELPDHAARTIANYLHTPVVSAAQPRLVNPEAHDDYLRGRYLIIAFRYDEATQYFKKATEIDPNYALGWAGLATSYCQSAMHGSVDPREVLEPCYEMAVKALALDPSLPQSHVQMAGAEALYRWDLNQADRESLRAIALDPKYAEAYHLRARILTASNRGGEAIQSQKQEMELDPFSRPWGMAETYVEVRQYRAAIDDAQLRLKNAPDDLLLLSFMAQSYHCLGDEKHALETSVRTYTALHDPASAAAIKLAYQKGGPREVLLWQLHTLEKRAKTSYVSPVSFASLYAQLGDRDKALASLEDGLRQHHPWMLWIQTDPAYDFLHADPRYRSLIQRIGVPPTY